MNNQVIGLMKQGFTVRQISEKLSLKRTQVQEYVDAYHSRQTKLRVVIIVLFCLIIAIIAGVSSRGENHDSSISHNEAPVSTTKRNIQPDESTHVYVIGREYMSNRPADKWFITDQDIIDSERPSKAPTKMLGILSNATNEINGALTKYQSISEVKALSSLFKGRLHVSTFSGKLGGTSRRIIAGNMNPDEIMKMMRNSLEVVYYAEGDKNAPRIANQFAKYDPQWHSLIISARVFTDVWRDALVIHELVHAKMDFEGAPSAHTKDQNDLWIGEELIAHKVERKVLGLGTRGGYTRELENISDKYSQSKSVKEFIHSVKIEDLRKLDTHFPPASIRESSMRISQYLIDLGNVWIEKNVPVDKVLSVQIEHYRNLTANRY